MSMSWGLLWNINGAVYAIYPWLQEHSYEYGFIFRYPEDKQDLTGVAEEVWHYRYVGKEAAQTIHDQGICLEEYLANGIPSVSPLTDGVRTTIIVHNITVV